MQRILTSNEWRRETYSFRHVRGEKMRAIDSALERFHAGERIRATTGYTSEMATLLRDADIHSIVKALEAWIGAKTDWRRSYRNQSGVVEKLLWQLNSNLKQTREEAEALREIEHARDSELNKLFRKCIVMPRSIFNEHGNLATWKRTKADAATVILALHHVRKLVDDLITRAFGESKDKLPLDIQQHITELVGKQLTERIGEVLPIVNIGVSTASAIIKTYWAKTFHNRVNLLVEFGSKLPLSNARAAIKAMERLYERKRNASLRGAVRSTVSAGMGLANVLTAGTSTPASAVASTTNAIAALMDLLFQVGRDYRECKMGNEYLNKESGLTGDAFVEFPLLGAYYVTECATSSLALFFVKLGGPAWQDDVEQLQKYHLRPVRRNAELLIENSRYVIVHVDGYMLKGNLRTTAPIPSDGPLEPPPPKIRPPARPQQQELA